MLAGEAVTASSKCRSADPEREHRTTPTRSPQRAHIDFLFVVKWSVRVVGARAIVTGQRLWPVVIQSGEGPGSDYAEAPVFRFEPATQASESS